MIQNVNFMGREEYLIGPAKKVVNKAPEYVGFGTHIENAATKVVDKAHEYVGSGTYFENAATKVFDTNKKVAEEQIAKINEAIKAKYNPFTIENKSEQVAKDLGNEWAIAHGLPITK